MKDNGDISLRIWTVTFSNAGGIALLYLQVAQQLSPFMRDCGSPGMKGIAYLFEGM
jgi:hypothetical protein